MHATSSPRFVLASGSPRRRELLAAARIRFEVVAPGTEESASDAFTIREITILNAARKALEVARRQPDAVVLGADTLVALDGVVIGKPVDLEQAFTILRKLSGRMHDVCTSVFVCSEAGARRTSFDVFSHVQFRALSDAQITDYLRKIDPMDKAGAYAAQGHGTAIIEEIRGSFTNVVGLPMDETLRTLREFGVAPTPM